MSDRVVALGQCSDDRRLVGEILVERAERYPRSFDDVAHPKGVAALFGHHLDRAGKNAFEALAASLLCGNEPNDPLAVRSSLRLALFGLPPRHRLLRKRALTSPIRESIAFSKYDIFSYLVERTTHVRASVLIIGGGGKTGGRVNARLQ